MSQNPAVQKFIADLYQEHRRWLYVWLYKKLGSSENAEDVLQDTFVKLLKQKNTMLVQQPKAYLTTIAKRIMIDRSRHEKIETAYLEYVQQQQLSTYLSPENIIEAIEILDLLAKALEKLPHRHQMVFLMHYIDGDKLGVIADKLTISYKTAYNDLVKVLVHFQRYLSH